MSTDDQGKKANETPSAETSTALDPEEAKRQAFRKLKPVGPIMKPPSDEEVQQFLDDPEAQERDHLLDAMARPETDDQDPY